MNSVCGVVPGRSIRSMRMFSRLPLAMMTRMPACCTFDAVAYFDCMPPRPAELFSVCIYSERSVPGFTSLMSCDCGSAGLYARVRVRDIRKGLSPALRRFRFI